jgi:hypothetical protein
MAIVFITESNMALLHDYSGKTGVSVDRCVSDALFDWLASVAPVTLEQMGLEPLKLRTQERDLQRPGPRTLR